MAKKALFDVLEKTIGKYVCNLDTDSLNVAIWSGKIQLHSLELDVGAVNAAIDRQATQAPNLALPLRVVDGRFSSFEVDVPWTHLMSRPVILRAKGLQVSVTPVDPHTSALIAKTSEETAADRIHEARRQSIATANDYRLQTNALAKLAEEDLEAEGSDSKNSKDAGFVARLARRIIENLQIEISDVQVTLQGAEASAGVVLKSLQLLTTDENGKKTFVDRSSKSENTFLHKSLVLRGLGAYLDEKEITASHSLSAIGEDMDTSGEENDDDSHQYILAPLSFTAKLRQASGNVCIDYPKYLLESELSALTVLVSKTQVELARKIQKQMQPAVDAPCPLFPEYRPTSKVTKENAREWWKYAYRCVGRLNGRRSWVEFFRAFQLRNEYVELYKRNTYKSECPWMTALSDKDKTRLEEIEEDLSISVSGLMTWRNIADARAKKEIEKKGSQNKTKPSLFGSLFAKADTTKPGEEDDPPIALSPDELKELETLTLKDVEAESGELSKDSKLCDLNFVLGALTVHLTTHDMRTLSTLNMGKVSTSWKANANGSFVYDLDLQSLSIEDRITPHTLFPMILSNQQRSNSDSAKNQAFLMRVEKTKTGDQKLVIKLKPFELVASPILIQELSNFASATNLSGPPTTLKDAHPMLRQSMTGSVDLFYDASEGMDLSTRVGKPEELKPAPTQATDFSGALFDAWKAKTESNTLWIMDLDLAAPVIVVPENCSTPKANVLILNLGHLAFRYGDIESSPRVKKWFANNPYPDKTVDAQYDYGALQVTSLTFIVGRAENWKELASDGTVSAESDPVLAPITASMHIGIESHSTKARLAAFLVLPLIAGSLSPSQVARILKVSKAWQKVAASMTSTGLSAETNDDDALSHVTTGSASSQRVRSAARKANQLFLPAGDLKMESVALAHFDVTLKRLSTDLSVGDGHGVEAHLVSVSCSATTFSDGGANVRASMGWFWILDRLRNDFTRTQRLIAHSALPQSADDYAGEQGYNIVEDLERRGVFDETFEGSSDLADVVVRHSAGKFGKTDPFERRPVAGDDNFAVDTIVDARFTSLYVNWNPYAIKELVSSLESFNELLVSETESERGPMILGAMESHRKLGSGAGGGPVAADGSDLCMLVRAELDGIELLLRSALDDLPLFTLSMTATKATVAVASGKHNGLKADVSVGNLQAVSSDMGRTCCSYRTLIGVSPGKSESLLTVLYSDGPRAMKHVDCPGDVESYGLIQLSPMRMVYIQSQILALVDYSTEGILGAITRSAASSAAAAAADMASAGSGEKLFVVKATGIEVVVPEAAYEETAMSVCTGELSVAYTVLPNPGGGEAKVSLIGMMLSDSRQEDLLSKANEMQVSVVLPPDGVGSADDQAMRVNMSMGDAGFVISKAQYAEVMTMVAKNVGDPNLYLRPNEGFVEQERGQRLGSTPLPVSTRTHAGSMVMENAKRIYTTITLAGLSLSLYGADHDDPIIRLTTDETRINADLFPNGEKLSTTISMKNLECFDERTKSLGREYRSLIYQDNQSATGKNNHLILLEYETRNQRDTTLKVSVGTPRIVFIPDALADTLEFFTSDEDNITTNTQKIENSPGSAIQTSQVKIRDEADGTAIEAMVVENATEEQLSNYTISLVTSDCCFIFVDLGSTSLVENVDLKSSMVTASTETFVVKGVVDCRLDMMRNTTSEIVKADAELHADGFEAYTAFGGSHDALQILEPAKLSLYANTKMTEDKARTMDVRVASVTTLDLCLSMKNIALLSAILSGLSDCLDASTGGGDPAAEMSQREAAHIEKLAAILQSDGEAVETTMSRPASFADSEVGTPSRSSLSAKLTLPELRILVVNDLQGLDDALFRVVVQNLVGNGSIDTGIVDHRMKVPFTGFTGNLNCSIISDYFDESCRSWKRLLLKPWEITVRAQRGMNSRLSARVPTTTCDIESFSCQIGFTEQFLMSLASANQMWAVYSTATTSALDSVPDDEESRRLRRAIAASAARTLVTVLPYVLENHCGREIHFTVHGGRETRSICSNSTMEYFRFPQPKGAGFGGRRLYGQDRMTNNSLSIFVDDHTIHLNDVDSMVSQSRQAHVLPTQEVIFIQVTKEGKTIAIHVSSSVDIVNKCFVPFKVSVTPSERLDRQPATGFVGTSTSRQRQRNASAPRRASYVRRDGRMTKPSSRLGVPIANLGAFHSDWASFQKCTLNLSISPKIEEENTESGGLVGGVAVSLSRAMFHAHAPVTSSFDVTCRSSGEEGERIESFVAQVYVVASLVRGLPHIEMSISPRALIRNVLPLSMSVRTPMPHTFSENVTRGQGDEFDIHDLSPGSQIEVYTPGPSIAVCLRCTDNPVAGNPTDWMEGGWVDLPLVSEFRLDEPFYVYLPFPSGAANESGPRRGGTEVVIAQKLLPHWDPSPQREEESSESIEVSAELDSDEWRKYLIGISHYAVDHTGEVLFEDAESSAAESALRSTLSPSVPAPRGQTRLTPLGAYRSESHLGRITLLPVGKKKIRMLHLTMEGEAGYSISAPFYVEDIAVCEGGVEATNIPWESGEESGFFAYRRLIDYSQSEIHIIPAYVLYNGSTIHTVRVKQPGWGEVTVHPGKIGALHSHPNTRLAISIEYEGFSGRTAPMNVDTAALRFAVVRSQDGLPIGSVAIETVVGAQDSRFVVKLSDLKLGSAQILKPKEHRITENDLIRFRIQWTELRVTLSEIQRIETALPGKYNNSKMARPKSQVVALLYNQQDLLKSDGNTRHLEQSGTTIDQIFQSKPVCTILFYRFTVDWQRVFKENQGRQSLKDTSHGRISPERSQISFIVHNVQIRDETEGSKYPVVFDSMTDASFFDICIRTRGPLTAELIDVGLVDIKLSYVDGKTRPIVAKLSEDFIWKLLDLSHRISEAANEFVGHYITLSYDEDHDGYTVSVSDQKTSFIENESKYTPPSSTTLYDFEHVQVSPFLLNISFDRTPQKSRYEKKKHIRGANLVNYFTRQLKFKIDNAELRFATFQASNIKGGSDRLIELLSTAYISRLKFKLVGLLTSASFQDWKKIASRQEGDDKYLEGDIMRVTGNLAGRSANYILKKAGMGLGEGIRRATDKVGDGFENAASAVGARRLGTGVNSVVSGVGQGVGEGLTGLGSGAGKVLKGTGQGIGQVFGGISGGAAHIGKGIGKGLKGDARGFSSSMTAGVASVGRGAADGVGTAIGGAADGVATLGKGLFSGVKSIGKGFGSAVTGKQKQKPPKHS